ncbi:MAG: hypothetical protein U9R16_01375 [Campylobacterota bacterium]|nr:hypothetical protein [Campylobacterota bacterium]
MEDIEQRVLLLGLYKKEDGETFNDILGVMENSRVFTKKIGKKYLKNLKELNYITDDSFTMLGISKAKEVEAEFKI